MSEILTTSEVAEFLKLKETTVYHLTQKKEIPHIKIGGAVRFDLDEIKEWLKSKRICTRMEMETKANTYNAIKSI